jgi:hypothetical protein
MIPASEGPDRARLHSQLSDATDVWDHIADAQGRIVHFFERFRKLLPQCNAPNCPISTRLNLGVASNCRQTKTSALARSDRMA